MTVYEIINPSDPYTIEGDDFAVVCLAVAILGQGAYGLKTTDDDDDMPILLFGMADDWFPEKLGKTFEELLNETPHAAIADCLDSVLLCSLWERKAYNDALAIIEDADKRQALREQWLEERRSSLNDIGGRAYALARGIRRKVTE